MIVYGTHHCSGISVHINGLAEYMHDRVRKRHYGLYFINEFPNIRSTGFKADQIGAIRLNPEPWSVGETFSECLLEDYKDARIPYPGWLDLKNQYASSTGADLVGFDYSNDSVLFLFGEVKTSAQTRRPPSVVHDLKRQLHTLESLETTQQLVQWLGLKIKTQKDRRDFSRALMSYTAGYMFKIVGVLIRDTAPDEGDLMRTFTYLADVLRPTMRLDMLAVYLPVALDQIPKMMDGER